MQTAYAARPWAFEMPSAGRPLSWEILLALRRRGVRWASLTHAAGLSATGDPALDAALPLPEAFEIPAATARAVAETRARNGRVVAVGTTVVRALEGAAAQHDGIVRAGRGETDLRITPAFRPRVVDGILSGAHAAHESHFQLLAAFAGAALLAAAAAQAERAGFLTHELGDSMLVLPGALAARVPRDRRRGGARVGCGRDARNVHGSGGARRGAARLAAAAARALARRHRRLDRRARAGGRDRDADGARIHAYLHRKEGDPDNARYWYRQAGRAPFEGSLADEWSALARDLLGRGDGAPR